MKKFCLTLVIFLPAFFLHAQWTQTNGPTGGYVRDIKKVGAELWAGTEGGLYISKDNGLSWQRSPLVPAEDNVAAITVLPGEILLGVVHYDFSNGSSANPQFLCYRSADGGQSFVQSDLPIFNWSGIIRGFQREGNRLYCVGDYADWIQSDDYGQSWTEVPLPPQIQYANAVAISGSRIVASDYYSLWKSDDRGVSWSFIDSTQYISSMFLENDLVLVNTVFGLRRSTDFGLSWTMDSTLADIEVESIRRGNQGELWIPGPGPNMIRSFDEGLNWSPLSFANPPNDYVGVLNAIQDGDDYWAATGRGIYRTENGAWTARNTGLIISRVYNLAHDQQGNLYASTNIGNFRTADAGANWQKLPAYTSGQGPGSISDWIISGSTMFVTDGDRLWRSTDLGQNWTKIEPNGQPYLSFADHLVLHNNTLYVPNDDNVLYSSDWGDTWQSFEIPAAQYGWYDDILFVGNTAFVVTNDGDLFRSTDNFSSWTRVLEFWSTGAHNQNRLLYFNNKIYSLGRLHTYTSADNGNTWQEVIPTGLPVDNWGDPFQLSYVLPAGNLLFGTIPYNGVYMSSDGGSHWISLNSGLDNLRGRWLAMNQSTLFLATSTGGVYRMETQFETVSGTVYNDLNNNGQQDPGEQPLPNILVAAEPLKSYAATNDLGTYGILANAFSDTLRAIPPTPYASVNPPYYLVDQPANDRNFGIHFTPGIVDLCVTATSKAVIRPGFKSIITLSAVNIGTKTSPPVSLKLVLPPGLQFDFAYPFPSQSGDTLSWTLDPLESLERLNIDVEVECAQNLVIGELLSISACIGPEQGDANPENNNYGYREPVVGSYDPNDKQVRPENGITPLQIAQGQRLEYTIRFENTGTFYADFIRILDTLSPDLDIASLQILASSHPVSWTLRDKGVLEFYFKDIFLEPSSWGEGYGHGFVKYSVRCRRDLPLNTNIQNTAHIFFDFNPPISTNTTQTKVTEILATYSPVNRQNALTIYPNPVRDRMRLSWAKPVRAGTLRIYLSSGQLALERQLAVGGRQAEIQLPNLPAGTYQVQWFDDQGSLWQTVERIR